MTLTPDEQAELERLEGVLADFRKKSGVPPKPPKRSPGRAKRRRIRAARKRNRRA